MFREIDFFQRHSSDSGETRGFSRVFSPMRMFVRMRRTRAEDRQQPFSFKVILRKTEVGVFYPGRNFSERVEVE